MAGNAATEVSVARLEVGLPSLSRPIVVRARGVRVAFQQARLPPPLGPEARAEMARDREQAERASKLAAVEVLLWGEGAAGRRRVAARSRWNPTGEVQGDGTAPTSVVAAGCGSVRPLGQRAAAAGPPPPPLPRRTARPPARLPTAPPLITAPPPPLSLTQAPTWNACRRGLPRGWWPLACRCCAWSWRT